MDYIQVSNDILCNGSNTTLHLQEIPFLSVLWKLYSLTVSFQLQESMRNFSLHLGVYT